MPTVADLHSHSIYSDGSLTLDSVTETIRNRHLSAFSVTDHDSLEFYGQNIPPDIKKRLIPGTELSTHFNNQSAHLLVYCSWPIPQTFRKLVKEFASYRKNRYQRICRDLAKTYPEWNWHISDQQSNFTSRALCQFISEKTGNRSLRSIYDNYLSNINMGYQEFPELSELLLRLKNIDTVKSFIAHPGHRGKTWESFWAQWKDLGLSGLELIHPTHKKSLRNYYKKILRREGLVASGGSDFHFPRGGSAGPGRMGLDKNQWQNFKQQCEVLCSKNSYTKN